MVAAHIEGGTHEIYTCNHSRFICHLSVFSCCYMRPQCKIKSITTLKNNGYHHSVSPRQIKAFLSPLNPEREDLLLSLEELHRASWSSYRVTMAINSISSEYVGSWLILLGNNIWFQEEKIGATENVEWYQNEMLQLKEFCLFLSLM